MTRLATYTVRKQIYILFFFGYILPNYAQNRPAVHDFQVALEAEYRHFFETGKFPNQEQQFPSFAIKPSYSLGWNHQKNILKFEGFYRYDIDKKRTHYDIREFYYQKVIQNFEVNIGVKQLFWGVTESNHLVDIINQTDQVERFDGEQKLGQPMLQFSYTTHNLGTFDIFYLPYFRKRRYLGEKSRLRFSTVIDDELIGFESKTKEWHQDFAVRWSYSFSMIDLGISHFYGTGREPVLYFNSNGTITGLYPIINQTGLDLQLTHNAWLWKLETIYRTSKFQDMFALTAGLEYTFNNIANSGLDIGLLGEYLYDNRGKLALSTLQNDAFLATRIAFNDTHSTQLLLGGIVDIESYAKIFSLEASRRLGNNFKIALEGRVFTAISDKDFILKNIENDSFLRLSLFTYF